MTNRRFVVFRTSGDVSDWIWSELQAGRLRQGWGVPQLQLIEDGEIVKEEIWVSRYIDSASKFWEHAASEKEAKGRYWILRVMTDLQVGDIAVIPKVPGWDRFTIATISNGYTWDGSLAEQRGGMNDFRHVVGVNLALKTFTYGSSREAEVVHKKMRAYQAALNNVRDADFISAVTALSSRESSEAKLSPEQLLGTTKTQLLPAVLTDLRSRRPEQLEDLVAAVFESAGYEVVSRHRYDGHGGDADLVLVQRTPVLSDYAGVETTVYVQVKNKAGIDPEDWIGVDQLLRIAAGDEDTRLVLISTADSLTERCKELARENDVILIWGIRTADMILSNVKAG